MLAYADVCWRMLSAFLFTTNVARNVLVRFLGTQVAHNIRISAVRPSDTCADVC